MFKESVRRVAKRYLIVFAAFLLGLCAVFCFLQFNSDNAYADDESAEASNLGNSNLMSGILSSKYAEENPLPLSDDSRQAFAVYSADDHSLVFYADETVPGKGDKYDGKTVTDVFTGFDSTRYSSSSGQPWKSYRSDIYRVVADESFSVIQPIGMRYWFYGLENCSSFDLANIDTSQVNNMSYLFVNCASVGSLDLSSWDTSNVTTMYSMFHQCYSLASVDVSSFDTSNVTTFGYMFYQCRSLNSIDVGNFNTSKATYFSSMFYECSSLSSLDVSLFDTSGATSMVSTFQKCTNLKHLDLSGWDTSKATTYSSFLKDDGKLLDIAIGGNFTLFNKSTTALTDIQTWYNASGVVVSDNYMVGFDEGAGTYYTYGIDYSDVDADIVGSETDTDTWADSKSVNVNEAIEVAMSTVLPALHADAVADGEYELTFHNKLDSGLDIDSSENDFKVEIDGTEIEPTYYSVDISNNAATFDAGFSPLSITTLDDGCTFHINVDISALYTDKVLTDDEFGSADVRVFFFASLEDVEDVNTSYANTIWYDISAAGDVLHTSDPVTVEVYTFEIDIYKTDADTGTVLPGATFGLYSDADCANPVQKNGADYVATTDDSGYVQFRGIAEGTYYVKELKAPDGYTTASAPYEATLELGGAGMDEHVYALGVEDDKEIIDISDPDSGITVTVADDGDGGFTYNGKPHTPHIVVTDKDGNVLQEGVDYDIEYGDNVNAGRGHIIIHGRGGYTGDIDIEFDIAPASVTIDVDSATKMYGMSDPVFTGTVTGVVEGDDLNVGYYRDGGENVGTYTITATYDESNANYSVTTNTGTLTITAASIDNPDNGFNVTLPGGDTYTYTGGGIAPEVVVTDKDGNELVEGTDYDVEYSDNVEIGTGRIVIHGSGNYTGDVTVDFEIVSGVTELQEFMFDVDTSWEIYDDEPIYKSIVGHDGGKLLEEGTDYTVAYENNDHAERGEVNTVTITIDGIGVYTGRLTYHFSIVAVFDDVWPYSDVNSWYFEAVYGLRAYNVTTGYSPDFRIFGVADDMTRADFVTMLWRYLEPDAYATYDSATAVNRTNMPDVEDGQYWTEAANWAWERNIITGFELGENYWEFKPHNSMTFEELATILARDEIGFDAAANYDQSVLSDPRFTDGDEVDSWARGSVAWAIDHGIVTGNDNSDGTYTIAPHTPAARARVATVLYRQINLGLLR